MGANIKIFSARSARFGAIIKFRDKIYTPGPLLSKPSNSLKSIIPSDEYFGLIVRYKLLLLIHKVSFKINSDI